MIRPNNYPQQYSDQEKQLMDQIAARRRAYYQKFGAAEDDYVNADRSSVFKDKVNSYDYETPDEGDGPDDPDIAKRLFS